ncbi:SusE domain-containing protein [Maribellus maritimus]|uniref:SusE domain-containing protein n=1 Tax=Maribellus maritimus TaxID=2870838 RepID=UPI001EEA2FA2|nr:SusE domain-containing protein [Maribellus maritimus]MCG6190091.1 SusE domain-containing protein [Maribellus maritimus]
MKKILFKLTVLSSLIFAFLGCEEDEHLRDTNVTAVNAFYEPADGKSVILQSSASASVYFEWEPAKAEDSGMVLYEVAFDVEGGDFTNPIYKMASDNTGGYNHTTISHKQLNKIGELAGIPSAETGTLIWTVFSSKGINELQANEIRTIEITRLAGFADVPVDVYVTGEGSEGGDDLSQASIMKGTAVGEYEIYTKLTAGEAYYFTDNNSGTPRQFYTEDGLLKEGESSSTVAETGVYRINLDFNVGSAVYTQITDVQLFFSPLNTALFSLDYQGGGVWKANSEPIEFKQEGWGRDERYKFSLTTVNSAGDTVTEWWGTLNSTDSRPNADSPDSYYYMAPATDDIWADKWKFAGEMDMAIVDVTVYFTAEVPYTHKIEKVGDQ